MVLSKTGSQIFIAYNEWQKYCKENNIEDPWHLERKIEKEYIHYKKENINGMEVDAIYYDDPTEEQKQRLNECHKYRDKYIKDRDIWVGKYILKNFGYNTLSIFAQTQGQEETAFHNWFTQIEPCEGNEQQCNMFCLKFTECPYRGDSI